jgi:hypothetical protein
MAKVTRNSGVSIATMTQGTESKGFIQSHSHLLLLTPFLLLPATAAISA